MKKNYNRLPKIYERMVALCERDIFHMRALAEGEEPLSRKEEEASELEWFSERIASTNHVLHNSEKPRMQKMAIIRQLLGSLQDRGKLQTQV